MASIENIQHGSFTQEAESDCMIVMVQMVYVSPLGLESPCVPLWKQQGHCTIAQVVTHSGTAVSKSSDSIHGCSAFGTAVSWVSERVCGCVVWVCG